MGQPINDEYSELEKLNKGVVQGDEIEGEDLDEEGDPVKAEEKQPEAEKPKEEAPAEEKQDAPAEELPKPEDKEPDARPERFIPMKKYHDEKREWETEREELKKRNAELETIAKKPAGSDSQDDAIKKYVEKHGLDEEAVRDLVAILPKGQELPKEALEVIQAAQATVQKQKEQEHFDTEFQGVIPAIKAKYPDADDKFIASVKTRLDELAHTKELSRTPLAYIFHGHAEEFQPVEAPKGKKTIEGGRPGASQPALLTAADFQGKTDFSALETMDEDARKRIIKDMDPDTWANFVQWAGKQEEDGVEVNRAGRKIVLK